MSEVEKHGSQLVDLVVAVIVIGITFGVTGIILTQFQAIQIGGRTVSIPVELTPAHYQGMVGLVVMLLVITVIVGVVFGYVIPKLKAATSAGRRE